ncbi:hypothetical protein D3C86_1209580 [compost metagenome]
MQPLEEGVLAIGARHAPDDGRRRHAHGRAVARDPLAQGLHFQLLQIGDQVQQARAVGRYVQRVVPQHAAIDEAGQRQLDRRVRCERRLLEMLVHGLRARPHAYQHVGADGQRNRQARHGPDRIAAAHPIAHLEDLAGRHAQRTRRRHIGGDRGQVLRHVGHSALLEPGDGGARVMQRLGRGEGLGRHDHQAAARVQPGHGVMKGMPVDVGHEADLPALQRAAESLDRQARPPIAAADADVQHRREIRGLVHAPHEVGHARVLAHGIRVLPVRLFAGAPGPQRGMPGRLVFGPVDRFPGKQPMASIRQPARLQQGEGRGVQRRRLALHRQVHAQPGRLDNLQRAGIQFGALRSLRKSHPFRAVRQSGVRP